MDTVGLRWLDNGRYKEGSFQQLVARIDEGEELTLTKDLLLKYLDGEDIQSKRTDFFQGC